MRCASGCISDTHGIFDRAIIRHFAGVEHILHAGDIGKREIIEQLEQIAPVTVVSGNVDGFRGERISGRAGHRTGRISDCALSSAL